MPMQGTRVESVSFSDDGAVLRAGNESIRARFVVDASGQGGVLARGQGLRKKEPGLKTRSRTLFTHMVDVAPIDDVVPRGRHRLPSPPSLPNRRRPIGEQR